MICPACKKQIDLSTGRPLFCPWCGERLPAEELLEERLREARAEDDPVTKYALLMKLREEYPGRLEVEREILYLGRMYERGGRPDFYRIPFWPLSALEKPREFSRGMRREMLTRFFENPELERVAGMAPDREAFIGEYLDEMAAGYVDLFIKHSNANSMFLGFRLSKADNERRCEKALIPMLINVNKSENVPPQWKDRLCRALVKGFERAFDSDAARRLEAKIPR
ncbi:MAG: hypothetical protein IK140_01145 [Clostridia bacterium]|nr:hypothetical protein [Clostridia bacterium]